MLPRIIAALAVLLCFLAASALAQQVAPTEPLAPADEQKQFHLPPGFEIQLVASEPAIHKPINLSFDPQGRLWVTDTLEYPFPATDPNAARDSVKVLVDRNGNGSADEVTTFVDKLNIPLGVQPIAGGVLVYSIPKILRCLDTDGDGRADTREPLYGTFGTDDTHGMVNSFTRGLDGWLYATHGFRNTSTVAGSDGQAITMNSGNTFRMKLDGSHVEYFTHGQVNPFGLAFDPLGNLYSADCHTLPIYQLLRGAYYPSFGKAHDGLDFGPTMIKHNHGSTGIGGVAYYAAEQFPAEYRDTVFIGNPVTGRVNHDRLEPHGSTYQAIEQPDFIRCDDPWFRPVNLQLGPDGALYIADFYNRIIGHYEVPLQHPGRDRERGRIWRVVYTGQGVKPPHLVAPNVSAASLDELITQLGHGNLTVRTLATHELVDRCGEKAIEPLTKLLQPDAANTWQRVHGLWVLERLGSLPWVLVEKLAGDPDRAVRVHLVKALAERSEWTDSQTAELVREKLADSDAFVRRAAADALGRHPHSDNLRHLLNLWATTASDDTHLVHVARMALRDQLMREGVYAAIASAAFNRTDRGRLGSVSLGIGNSASAAFVWSVMQDDETNVYGPFLQHVARHTSEESLPGILEAMLKHAARSLDNQLTVVRAVGRGLQERGAATPPALAQWTARLAGELLASDRESHVRSGIDLARELKAAGAAEALAKLAGEESRFAGLRTAAIDAYLTVDGDRAVALLGVLLGNAAEPLNVRQHVAGALARMNTDPARDLLAAQLKLAPENLAVSIASALADSPDGAEKLLAAVTEGKAAAALLQEPTVEKRLRARNLSKIDQRLAKLTAGLVPRDQKFRELVDRRRQAFAKAQPDLSTGVQIFKKSCANCHRIGEEGAKIGPNLDGVGIRGLDRILEDLLDPNRNIDQAFRTTQIVTTDGRILSGLALREEGELLVLADAQGKEIRVPRDEIEQKSVSPLSLMPANVSDQIPETELPHLLAYLMSQRQAIAATPSGNISTPSPRE